MTAGLLDGIHHLDEVSLGKAPRGQPCPLLLLLLTVHSVFPKNNHKNNHKNNLVYVPKLRCILNKIKMSMGKSQVKFI